MWVKGEITHSLTNGTDSVKDSLARAQQPHLFNRLSWFQLLWQHNAIGERPLVARAYSSGAQAMLMMAEQGKGRVTALANYYTLAYRPVFTGADDLATRLGLLKAIAQRLRKQKSKPSHIRFAPVPRDGSAALLTKAFSQTGWHVITSPAAISWTVSVQDKDFETYWAERPGELRSTFARKRKKAALAIEIHTKFSEEAWADYEMIYAESWKPEEGSTAFLKALAQTEGEAGCLRLGIARHDDQAIAAQLWTLEPDRAIIHKLAYRQSAAELSPGTILTAAMFEYVIDTDKVSMIDYGTGDDRYKADWMDTRTELDQIDCYNVRTPLGLWWAARAHMAALVRRDPQS